MKPTSQLTWNTPTLFSIACLALLVLFAMPAFATSETAEAVVAQSKPATDSEPVDLEALFGDPTSAKSSCSASFACGDGNTASCTGTTCAAYTSAVPAHVKCDGQKYFCPNMCYVEVACSATGRLFCSSNVGDCQSGSNWVQCDGNYFQCPNIGGPES